jgi:hypothetical protein
MTSISFFIFTLFLAPPSFAEQAVAAEGPEYTLAASRLSALGLGGKKFVIETDGFPKTERDPFYARFEDPIKIMNVQFPHDVSIGVEYRPANKLFKAADEIKVIRVESGLSFVYQGVPCMTVSLRKGLMEECVLAKDFRVQGFMIPARSHLHFRPMSSTNAKPLYVSQLRTDTKINGQMYRKGQNLKITDKGVTNKFNPMELTRLNGGK